MMFEGDHGRRWWDSLSQGLCLRLQERLPGRDLRDGREERGVQGGPQLREDRESGQRSRLSDGDSGL